jgi:hypothetical protein
MPKKQRHVSKISNCAPDTIKIHSNEAPRGAKTVAGAATGALLGGVVGGPIGAAFGGIAGLLIGATSDIIPTAE